MAIASRKWLLAVRHNSIAPFLYQTRTLAAPALRKSYSTTANDSNNPDEDASPSPSSTTAKTEPEPRPTFLQKHAASRISSSNRAAAKKPKIAMTRGEKKVFGELLGELQWSETEPAFTTTEGPKKKSEGGGGNEMSRLAAIFDSVLAEVRGKDKRGGERRQLRRRSAESILEEGEEEDEMWSEMTLGEGGEALVDISEILGEEGKQVPMQRAIKIIVKRESEKIENILREAVKDDKGDIGIWDVCKARIFSMLEHIGQNPARARKQAYQLGQGNEQPTLDIPSSVPVEPVVISLYPKMLLVAFRLLNQHYPKSQLIGQFRSSIKSHGRASAVLGTSTALYNELITFYWQGMNDLGGVISLLHEMEVIGVDANERTCRILSEILRQRDRDLKEHRYRHRQAEEGEKVRVREPWWDMAPNRRAVRELLGPEGWVNRLEARVQKKRHSI